MFVLFCLSFTVFYAAYAKLVDENINKYFYFCELTFELRVMNNLDNPESKNKTKNTANNNDEVGVEVGVLCIHKMQ